MHKTIFKIYIISSRVSKESNIQVYFDTYKARHRHFNYIISVSLLDYMAYFAYIIMQYSCMFGWHWYNIDNN